LNSPGLKSSTGRDQVSPPSALTAVPRGQSLPDPGRLLMITVPSARWTSLASPSVGRSHPIGTSPPDSHVRPWSSL
jgi:hypothetical protein